ncbi:hypothetical protein R6Q57_007245 [Mikania cordata]
MKIPYVGLNFGVYESLKDWLVKSRPFGLAEDTELGVTTKLACGAAAGTVVKLLLILLMSSAEECKWLVGNMQLQLSLQMASQRLSTPEWLMLSGKPFDMKSNDYTGDVARVYNAYQIL